MQFLGKTLRSSSGLLWYCELYMYTFPMDVIGNWYFGYKEQSAQSIIDDFHFHFRCGNVLQLYGGQLELTCERSNTLQWEQRWQKRYYFKEYFSDTYIIKESSWYTSEFYVCLFTWLNWTVMYKHRRYTQCNAQ